MRPYYQIELLHILWSLYPETEYITPDGNHITVLRHGEYDDKRGRFCGAKIRDGENIHHGDIVIWAGDELPQGDFESTILHVTPFPSAGILKSDGQLIPQVMDAPDPVCTAAYGDLREGAGEAGCAGYVASLEKHERIALFTRLMVDRLYRKYREVLDVYESSEQNWTETVYAMLLRGMGTPTNKAPFSELARRVGYKHICKEKSSIQNIEALLLGTSGLLEMYDDDQYIRELKTTFDHYCRKYGIVPMRPGQWKFKMNNPLGHPVIRLAQLASFFKNRDFVFDSVMKCRTVEDIHKFFDAEASLYWSTHYIPGSDSVFRPKRVGPERSNVMGINFIVPMQFAYGIYFGDESLKEASLDLLEKINPETNHIVNKWRNGGTLTENAFDSQAILQINNEYCMKGLCWKCPAGKRIVKEVFKGLSAQKM